MILIVFIVVTIGSWTVNCDLALHRRLLRFEQHHEHRDRLPRRSRRTQAARSQTSVLNRSGGNRQSPIEALGHTQPKRKAARFYSSDSLARRNEPTFRPPHSRTGAVLKVQTKSRSALRCSLRCCSQRIEPNLGVTEDQSTLAAGKRGAAD